MSTVMLTLVIFATALYLPVRGIAFVPVAVNLFRNNGLMQDSDYVVSDWWQRARKRRSTAFADSENVVKNEEEKGVLKLLKNDSETLNETLSQKHTNRSTNLPVTGALPLNDISCLPCLEIFEYPELQRSIDIKADPCNNFYEFVCSGFQKENAIPDDQESVSQMGLLEEKTKNMLDELFDNRKLMKEIAPYDQLMYHVYNSCINETARSQDGSQILIKKLRVLWDSHHEFVTDWMIAAFPAGAFYGAVVTQDFRNPQKQMLKIAESSLMLQSEKFYLEKSHHSVIKAYRELLRGVLTILSNDSKAAAESTSAAATLPFSLEPNDIEKRIDALLNFETKLALMTNATDKKYDDAYSLTEYTTVAELQQNVVSSINWEKLLTGIMPELVLRNFTSANKTIGEMEVMIYDVPNLLKYEQLVRSLSAEETQFYLDWKVIFIMMEDLDDRYDNIYSTFNNVISGSKTISSKNESCRESARSIAFNNIERVYLREHYNESAIVPIIRDISENIDAAFRQMLRTNTWMDDKTRDYAMEKTELKISRMKYVIGVPKSNKDNITKSRCEKLDIDAMLKSNFAETQMIYHLWSSKRMFCSLLEPPNISFEAIMTNAMYMLLMNAVVIPSGILRGVFFNANRPAALNYGSIGMILAHEMIHGFDNSGRQHDASGAVRNWWDKETEQNFINHKRCLIEQYSRVNITNSTLHVDGELTQGENIADNGGMRAAFLAFEAYLAKTAKKEQPRIRGIEQFDTRQQFFLSYAFSWCGADQPEYRTLALLTDSHPPRDVRINVVLSNMQEFANAFHCPANSPMNPTKKCRLW